MADSWPRPVANSGLAGLKWGLGSGLWEVLGDSGMNACRDACGKVQMLVRNGRGDAVFMEGVFICSPH